MRILFLLWIPLMVTTVWCAWAHHTAGMWVVGLLTLVAAISNMYMIFRASVRLYTKMYGLKDGMEKVMKGELNDIRRNNKRGIPE